MPNTRYVGDSTRALRACDGGKDPGTKQACVTLNKGLHCSEPLSFPTCACGWQSRAPRLGWHSQRPARSQLPTSRKKQGASSLDVSKGCEALCPEELEDYGFL